MAQKRTRNVETWPYVPKGDRGLPIDEQTTFRLRPLSGIERDKAIDEEKRSIVNPDGTVEMVTRSCAVQRALCLSHIETIENFPGGSNGNGEKWPPATDREARERFLEMLDDALVIEIGNEIYRHSALIGEEKKTAGESSPPAPISS